MNALLLCGVHAAKWNMKMRMNTIIENPKTYPQYIMVGRRNRSVARGSNAHSLNSDGAEEPCVSRGSKAVLLKNTYKYITCMTND